MNYCSGCHALSLHRYSRIASDLELDPAVVELEGCYLYDIDDLERVVAESVAGRREEAVRAEAIVSEAFDATVDALGSFVLYAKGREDLVGQAAQAEEALA